MGVEFIILKGRVQNVCPRWKKEVDMQEIEEKEGNFAIKEESLGRRRERDAKQGAESLGMKWRVVSVHSWDFLSDAQCSCTLESNGTKNWYHEKLEKMENKLSSKKVGRICDFQ